jgi:hypothetical protein
MKTASVILRVSLVLAAAFLLLSCNALENKTQSASLLIVENLMGTDLDKNEVNYLQSDVLIQDSATGAETITADAAVATFRVTLLDPNPGAASSVYNDVQLNRYVVTFNQPNGNNIEGRDVPYSFEGSMSSLIRVGTSADVAFIIVREVAKIEPPLVSLRDGTDILQVTANITFYGKDMAGQGVKATGTLTIFFANYANE